MDSVFVWTEHLGEVVTTALLSMVPMFEGRYAVVTGLAIGMPKLFTFLLALVFSSLPIPFIFWFLKPILKWLYGLPIGFIRKFAAWVERRSQKKANEVDAKGLLGLFLFVAVPLPGTGVWSGTAIATLLEMKKSHAALAILAGNFVACLLMAALGIGVTSLF